MPLRLIRSLCVLLALWLGAAFGAQAAALQLTQAQAAIQVDGQAVQHLQAALPYSWDWWHRGSRGHADFQMHFSLGEIPQEPWLLYFLRLGNAYEVRLNGALLGREGDLERFDRDDYGQVPRLVTVPVGTLQRDNVLVVRVRADASRRAGVAAPWVGSRADVLPLYEREHLQRVTGTRVVVVICLLVGTMALALWWTQVNPVLPPGRQRDPLYLFAALAEYSWGLRVGGVLLESPPLSRLWWDTLSIESLGVWVWAMLVFSALAAGWRGRVAMSRLHWAMAAVLVSGPACIVAAQWGHRWLLTLWYAGIGAIALPFACVYCWAAVRRGVFLPRLIAAALLLNALVGVRDWIVFRMQMTMGSNTLMRYSSLVFGAVLAYIVLTRFREASAQVDRLLATMGQRIAAKEQELSESYRQMERLAREQERVNERTRILRDLHDGVGSHISAAMRQLQSGKVSSGEVLQTLRDSLDQLKLTIDAMHLPAGDVTGLLANLRYRLEPRLAAAGIELSWDVDQVEPIQRLDVAGMRHLQFMVLESLSNVLQHAHASRLRVEAKPRGRSVVIRIEDDGVGFGAAQPPRNGLRTLRERAKAIGAALQLHGSGQGAVVEIVLEP